MNHDAVAVQLCLSAGLNEAQTDALLTRLSEIFVSDHMPKVFFFQPVPPLYRLTLDKKTVDQINSLKDPQPTELVKVPSDGKTRIVPEYQTGGALYWEDQYFCVPVAAPAAQEPLAVDLKPHLEWALRRIAASLDVGDHFEAARAALAASEEKS